VCSPCVCVSEPHHHLFLQGSNPIDACIITVGHPTPHEHPLADWHRVDVEMAAVFGRVCKSLGAQYLSLLSSVGVDETAELEAYTSEELGESDEPLGMWAIMNHNFRMKRLAENAVAQSGVSSVTIFRPSNLITDVSRYGWMDKLVFLISPWIDPVVPVCT